MTDDRLDACLELVADRRRRMLIRWLHHEVDGETTVDHLVDRLHEGGSHSGGARPPVRDELAVRLAHVHLPKLAEYGVVEFCPEERTVQYRPDELVQTVLDSLPGDVRRANP